jgi:thiol:disulfide interchange protein
MFIMKKLIGLSILCAFLMMIPPSAQAEGIKWFSYNDGLKRAKAENKKIFLNFHAEW